MVYLLNTEERTCHAGQHGRENRRIRILKEWFQKDICTICAPSKYWSIEQRLSYYRDLKSGRRRVKSNNGLTISITNFDR